MDSPRRQSAATSTSGSSHSSERQLSVRPSDWEELWWPEFLFAPRQAEYSEQLEGLTYTKSRRLWPKSSSRRFYHSVGLSANSKLAFVLDEHGAAIYFLIEPPQLRAELRAKLSVELLQPSKGEVVDAVLSNRYFAAVDRYKLDVFALDANGCLVDRHFSTALENQANRSNWVPTCLSIFDESESCTWVAVGFRVKGGDRNDGDIKVYLVEASGNIEEIGRYDGAVRSTIARPLKSEFVRNIKFSEDGDRLACVTNNNTVLIWSWLLRGKTWNPPFKIRRDFIPDAGGKGTLKSATLFKSPSKKPYVLCTTSPSSERGRTGEWSFVSPAPLTPASVPMEIQHSIQSIRDSVLAGAATSVGDLIAVLGTSGKVKLLAMDRGRDGGLRCHAFQHPALKFDLQLSRQESASPTSLRFQETPCGLHIFAIDSYGKLIVKTVMVGAYPQPDTRIPPGPHELFSLTPMAELDQTVHQMDDLVAPNCNIRAPSAQPTEPSTRRVNRGLREQVSRRGSLP